MRLRLMTRYLMVAMVCSSFCVEAQEAKPYSKADDLVRKSVYSNSFTVGSGNVGPNGPEGRRSVPDVSPAQEGNEKKTYDETRWPTDLPQASTKVMPVLGQTELMRHSLDKLGVDMFDKIIQVPLAKALAIVGYNDPTLLEALTKSHQVADSERDAILGILQTYTDLVGVYPEFRFVVSSLNGCWLDAMKTKNLSIGAAVHFCSGRYGFPGAQGDQSDRKSDADLLAQAERFHFGHDPDAKAAGNGGTGGPSVGKVGALVKNASFVEKAGEADQKDKERLLSDLIYEAPLKQAGSNVASQISFGPSIGGVPVPAVGPNFGQAANNLKRVQDSKKIFIELTGDLLISTDPRGGASRAVTPEMSPYFISPIKERKPAASGAKKISKEQEFNKQLEATWKLLIEEAKEHCKFYEKGGQNFSGPRPQRGKETHFLTKMKTEPRKDLAIPGIAMTPALWDILMWMALQGRTIDVVERDKICDEIGNAKLDDLKKGEYGKLDPKIRDMNRAYFWYSAFVATGKTLGLYRQIELDLYSIGLDAQDDDRTAYVSEGLKLIRMASGFPQQGDGGIQGAIDRNLEDFQEFLEKLKKYRMGIPSANFGTNEQETKRPSDILGAGGGS